jgi:hypothetical protein
MRKNKTIFAVSMAVLFGLIFWQQNPTLGISMGLCMGVAFGLFSDDEEENRNTEASKDEDRNE